MSEINFNALQGTTADQGAQKTTTGLRLKIFGIFALFTVGCIVVFIISAAIPFLFIPIMVGILGWLILKSKKYAKQTIALVQQLAKDNSWQDNMTLPADIFQPLSPTVMDMENASSTAISGSLNGIVFWFIVNSNGACVVLDAKKTLPIALLVNTIVDLGEVRLKVMRQLPDGADFSKISLEGDFDKYFHLYAKKSEVDDVLSIIAPDFMLSMIQKGRVGSMSMQGHYCYLESSPDKASLRGILEAAEAVSAELAH